MTIVEPMAVRPIPRNRGRWRLALMPRVFSTVARMNQPTIGELVEARSRRLEETLDGTSSLTFSMPGTSRSAALLSELQHEVVAYRWDEARTTGNDEIMFRGVITHTQDVLSEQVHTVNVTCQDYSAMLKRRFLTSNRSYPNNLQDQIVMSLIGAANTVVTSGGTSLHPGSELVLQARAVYPDGVTSPDRPTGGPYRTRNYEAQTNIFDAIDNLSNVINGFDWDVQPNASFQDYFRIYYPYKGLTRTDFAFVYGSTVSTVSRSINSANYANYVRVLGQSEPDHPQVFAETWRGDANDQITNPRGLWMMADSASDVKEIPTLVERAGGLLNRYGTLVPSYSLGLRPGVYYRGAFGIGDTVGLRIRSGRLDVDTWVRVVGRRFVIGDDGQEDVEVDVGIPERSFFDLITSADRRVDALERRRL